MQEVRDDKDKLETAAVYLLHIVGQIVQHVVQVGPLEVFLLFEGRRGRVVHVTSIVDKIADGLGADLSGTTHLVGSFTAELDDGNVVPFLQRAEECSQGRYNGLLVFIHGAGDVDGEDIVGPLVLQFFPELLHQFGIVGLESVHALGLGKRRGDGND